MWKRGCRIPPPAGGPAKDIADNCRYQTGPQVSARARQQFAKCAPALDARSTARRQNSKRGASLGGDVDRGAVVEIDHALDDDGAPMIAMEMDLGTAVADPESRAF